jgi:hypothetical protein
VEEEIDPQRAKGFTTEVTEIKEKKRRPPSKLRVNPQTSLRG